MKPKCALIRDPGSNCQRESRRAAELAGFEVDDVFVKELLEGRKSILQYNFLFDIGGFGHGDYIGAGRVKALRLRKLENDLRRFHEEGGLFLGVCNGFQDMVKGGLLTSSEDPVAGQDLTLYHNKCGNFRNQPVYLENVNRGTCVFTRGVEDVLCLPMRNGEGMFMAADDSVKALYENDQVVFKYVCPDGTEPEGESLGVYDPTGSVDRIAGICNRKGTWMGLMPHPECAIDPFTDYDWTGEAGPRKEGYGMPIFINAADYVRKEL